MKKIIQRAADGLYLYGIGSGYYTWTNNKDEACKYTHHGRLTQDAAMVKFLFGYINLIDV